jgi:hypothetical protein
MASVPTNSDAVAHLPALDAGAERIHHAGDFVPGDARILHSRPQSLLNVHIGVTDSASLDFYARISRPGLRYFAFHQFERPFWFGHLHGTHPRH